MSEDNMSAEQAPHSQEEAVQQEPLIDKDSWLASAGDYTAEKADSPQEEIVTVSGFHLATDEAGPTGVNFTVTQPPIRDHEGASGLPPARGRRSAGAGRLHWGKRVAIAAGSALAGAAVLFGVNQAINSGSDDDNSSHPGVVAGFTPDTKGTATSTPTVEGTPPKVEKYPLELGKTIDFGNVDVNLTKDLMETGVLLDVNTGDIRKEGLKIQDVILNPDVPDAEQRLNNAILYGEFLAWQNENSGRSGITFEQFKEKVDNNEDVSFSLYDYTSGDIVASKGEFKVDPRKKVHIVLTSTPSPNIQPFGGNKYGYRIVNGELWLELWDYQAFGVGDKVHADSDIDVGISWVLALMPEKQVQKDENLPQTEYSRVYARQQIFDKMLILKNSTEYWSGVLNVR